MRRLENRRAIVTGAAGGIGSAIALRLAEEGAAVVLTDLDADGARANAARLTGQGLRALGLGQDVTCAEDWETLFRRVEVEFGGFDILVNNAGVAHVASIEEVTWEDWRRVQAINVDSVFLGTQGAIREMRDRGGSIINISSIRALVGNPATVAYDSAKAAVAALTRSAALHCARKGYAIRINSVHPGYVATTMVRDVLGNQPDPEAARAAVMAAQPLGRMAEPEEIANAVLFLASEESSFMIASQLVVDGGYTAQ